MVETTIVKWYIPAHESIIKLSSSTNFWIVLALAGDSTITNVIPSLASSQLDTLASWYFDFDFVANSLKLSKCIGKYVLVLRWTVLNATVLQKDDNIMLIVRILPNMAISFNKSQLFTARALKQRRWTAPKSFDDTLLMTEDAWWHDWSIGLRNLKFDLGDRIDGGSVYFEPPINSVLNLAARTPWQGKGGIYKDRGPKQPTGPLTRFSPNSHLIFWKTKYQIPWRSAITVVGKHWRLC